MFVAVRFVSQTITTTPMKNQPTHHEDYDGDKGRKKAGVALVTDYGSYVYTTLPAKNVPTAQREKNAV